MTVFFFIADSYTHHASVQVDAQNKFMGKSFEIRPTGVAHAELLLPESQEPSYPKAISKDKVIEHYSWKKVTTNISGFILGSPTIDHYGDMIVRGLLRSDEMITDSQTGHESPDERPMCTYIQTSWLAWQRRVRDLGLRNGQRRQHHLRDCWPLEQPARSTRCWYWSWFSSPGRLHFLVERIFLVKRI